MLTLTINDNDDDDDDDNNNNFYNNNCDIFKAEARTTICGCQ